MKRPEASRRQEVIFAFTALTVMYLGFIAFIAYLAPTREDWLGVLWSEVGAWFLVYLSMSSLGLAVMATRARERRWLGWLPAGIAGLLLLADLLPRLVCRGGGDLKLWALMLTCHIALVVVVARWHLARAGTADPADSARA